MTDDGLHDDVDHLGPDHQAGAEGVELLGERSERRVRIDQF